MLMPVEAPRPKSPLKTMIKVPGTIDELQSSVAVSKGDISI
jgi:hypothetical protein